MSALAALAVIGSSALAGGISAAMQNSANANLDNANRQWQERMWHEANAYNAPKEQRKRFEAAGINPALAFQSGNTGVAASSPTPNQHIPADYSALGSGFSQAGSQIIQAYQADANVELLNSQAEANRIDNLTRLSKNLAEIDSLIADAKQKGANTSYLEWQRDQSMMLYDAISKKSYAEVENLRQDSLLKGQQIRREAALADYQNILNKYAVPNQEKVLRNLDAQYNEIMSAAANNNASAAYAAAQKALTDVNADTAKKVQRFVVDQAFQQVEQIKDDRELKWLQESYRQTGKVGNYFPSPVPQYKVGVGLKRAEKQRKR